MNLPAGLITNHDYEFFTDNGAHAFCLNSGRAFPFAEFSEELISVLEIQFGRFPEKIAGVKILCQQTGRSEIEQLLICNYGGFDNKADMVDGKLLQSEFWNCPNRGKCAMEGIVCDKLQTPTGQFLTHREIQVVKLTAIGHLDKEIGDHLNIRVHTVTKHQGNIRRKLNLPRKVDITRFAFQKQLVS